ncbi:unnamed protein product, partial [Natator depressus]
EAPQAGGKGQGKKKGKGPAKTTRPSVAGATPTAAAPPPTTASSPATLSTSSADVPPSAPRTYARVAATPPPATSSSLPPTTSATINSGRGPFPTMTRKYGVRCLLVPASTHMETYMWALARVVGPSAIVAASKMYGKKADLRDIRNWRPVSLISTDYKIVAKAISLRLGSVLADVIHPDQTYTKVRLTGLVLREPELRLVLSVYADDVLLVIQDPGDLSRVEACQAIYSAASSARVNWVKSSGLE